MYGTVDVAAISSSQLSALPYSHWTDAWPSAQRRPAEVVLPKWFGLYTLEDEESLEPLSSPVPGYDEYSFRPGQGRTLLWLNDIVTNFSLVNGSSVVNGNGSSYLNGSSLANCTPGGVDHFPPDLFTPEQRSSGAVLFHTFLACYLFILLAFVCDDYFVPSIKTLCQRLQISEDVAGATFMAAATSSPELFINVVGTFVTQGDIGIGTIVGSAVFNILAVPACCGLFGGQRVLVEWKPLTRDCLVYGITVILLIFNLRDGRVDWYEALVMVSLYVIYIAGVYFNDRQSNVCKKRKQYEEIRNLEKQPLIIPTSDAKAREGVASTSQQSFEEEDEESNLWEPPKGFWSRLFFFLTWPIQLVLYITVPDCRPVHRRWLWPFTFIMCVVWIASTSYLVSWMITVLGNTLLIPDSVMGLTLLAAGMSVPEAASSVIVTNQGHGSMGISSSIGSNTFDILLCLGLPWLIKSAFLPKDPAVHAVLINSQGLEYNTLMLLTTLLLLYAAFVLNGFVLDYKIGLLTLAMYLTFLVLATMVELNVFGIVNLPTCPS